MSPTIDLNSDLDEGFGVWSLGDDEALLGVVTSANVACGFHAGDPDILRRMCGQAAERGMVIGAQVGYHDMGGFGRRAIDVERRTLTNDVIYQVAALDAIRSRRRHPRALRQAARGSVQHRGPRSAAG